MTPAHLLNVSYILGGPGQFLDKTHQFSSPHTVQSLHIPARSWYLPRETKDCTSHIPTRPATHIHKACLWLQCRHHRFHFGLAVPTFYLLLLGGNCASVSRLFSVPRPLTETEKDCRLRWSSLAKPSLKTSTKRDKAVGQGGGKRREAEFMKISTKGFFFSSMLTGKNFPAKDSVLSERISQSGIVFREGATNVCALFPISKRI